MPELWKQIAVKMTPETVDRLQEYASERERSLAWVVRHACVRLLNDADRKRQR